MTQKSPLSTTSLVLLTIALGLGTFIQILDTTIANVAIPNIAGKLGVSIQQGTWVITSFAVSNAIVLPLTGWLAGRLGGAKLFIWSTALFSLASFLCGVAPSFNWLIVFRVIQGAVAGTLIPLSQSLLLTYFPKEKKGLALGFWSMVVVVAPVIGPALGGLVTDLYGWPWIFFINVPIGLFSAILSWSILRKQPSVTEKVPIDVLGLSFLIIGVGALQIFLDKGNELAWFESNFIMIAAALAVVFLLLFIAWSFNVEYPVVDLSLFKDRNFLVSTVVSAFVFLVFFSTAVVLPLWLQTQKGYTAFMAGVALMPIGFVPLFLYPILGQYLNRLNLRLVAALSIFIFAVTSFWYSWFTIEVTLEQILIVRFVQGFGVALFFLPLITLALSHIDEKHLASASGVYNFFRLVIGGGAGPAIYIAVWNQREVMHYRKLTEGLLPNQVINSIITNESYLLAFNDLMRFSGWMLLVLIPLLWFCQEPKKYFTNNDVSP